MLVTFVLDFKCGLHSCKCNRPLAVTSAQLHASVQMHHLDRGRVPSVPSEPQPWMVRHRNRPFENLQAPPQLHDRVAPPNFFQFLGAPQHVANRDLTCTTIMKAIRH